MKKLIALACIAMSSYVADAQQDNSVEKLLSKSVPACTDIAHNAMDIIPDMHEQHLDDSLVKVMAYWESKCGGIGEPQFTFKILYAIENGNFSEKLYEKNNAVWLMRQHKKNLDAVTVNKSAEYDHYRKYYRHTQAMAASLLHRSSLTSLERLFLRYYAGNSYDLDVLETIEFGGTLLQAQYHAEQKKDADRTGTYAEAYGGAWAPMGNMSLLGTHPYLGFGAGWRGKRLLVGVGLTFAFIKASNTYTVVEDGVTYGTRHFFQLYGGLDAAYELVKMKKQDILLLGGIGIDGMDVLAVGKGDDQITKSLAALNLNAGLSYRFWLRKYGYLGVNTKFNYMTYNNKGGTDISGNAVTIGLVYGGLAVRSRR